MQCFYCARAPLTLLQWLELAGDCWPYASRNAPRTGCICKSTVRRVSWASAAARALYSESSPFLVSYKTLALPFARELAKRVSRDTVSTIRAFEQPYALVEQASSRRAVARTMLLITALLVTKCCSFGAAAAHVALTIGQAARERGCHQSHHRTGERGKGQIPRLREYCPRHTFQARASAADALRADFLAGARRRGARPGLSDWWSARGRGFETARRALYAAAAREHSRRLEARTGGAAAGEVGCFI